MQKCIFLGANMMAAFLDFAVGCFIVSCHIMILVLFFPQSPTGSNIWFTMHILWGFPDVFVPLFVLTAGGLLALLPDLLDFAYPLLIKGGVSDDYNHRETLAHKPLVVLPVAIAIAWILGDILWAGNFWAITAGLCVTWHYLHDTWPLSGGAIKWLWPFSNRYISWRGFEKVDTKITPYSEWMQKNWFVPSRLSRTEIFIGSVLFSASVSVLLYNQWWIWVLWILPGLGSGIVWCLGPQYMKPR